MSNSQFVARVARSRPQKTDFEEALQQVLRVHDHFQQQLSLYNSLEARLIQALKVGERSRSMSLAQRTYKFYLMLRSGQLVILSARKLLSQCERIAQRYVTAQLEEHFKIILAFDNKYNNRLQLAYYTAKFRALVQSWLSDCKWLNTNLPNSHQMTDCLQKQYLSLGSVSCSNFLKLLKSKYPSIPSAFYNLQRWIAQDSKEGEELKTGVTWNNNDRSVEQASEKDKYSRDYKDKETKQARQFRDVRQTRNHWRQPQRERRDQRDWKYKERIVEDDPRQIFQKREYRSTRQQLAYQGKQPQQPERRHSPDPRSRMASVQKRKDQRQTVIRKQIVDVIHKQVKCNQFDQQSLQLIKKYM